MTPVSSATLALQIFANTGSATSTVQKATASGNLTIVASGAYSKGVGATASAQTSDALFSVNSPNLNKMKLDLFKRVGEVLGVKEEDYDTQQAYGAALKQAVVHLKNDPDYFRIVSGIEKELGLDKLGVSLDTVLNAITDPGGDDDKKLDAALGKQLGEDEDKKSHRSVRIRSDDIGIYVRG